MPSIMTPKATAPDSMNFTAREVMMLTTPVLAAPRWLGAGLLLAYACIALPPSATHAAIAPPQPLAPITHMEQVKAYLITVGLGPALHARYGHSFIKIITDQGIPRIYNWGMFSFNDPLFGLKFYLGERRYWVASTTEAELIYLYKHIEDRHVKAQRLQLTAQQMSRFLDGIAAAITPAAMFFNYEHFSDNCATIPRDILNEALDGYLYNQLSSQPATKGYRGYVVDHMAFIPPLGMLLDVVMNSKLDGPISRWDETFYPAKLSEYLSALPMLDDHGRPHPTTKLLGEPTTLVSASQDHSSEQGSFARWFLLIMLSLIMLTGALASPRQRCRPLLRRAYTILSRSVSLFWGTLSGTLGCIMLISWVFSTHLDMHHNLNLALFYPCDFILIAMAWRPGLTLWRRRWCYGYVGVHLISMAALGAGVAAGLISQNVHTSLLYLLPIQLGFLAWLLIHQRYQPWLPSKKAHKHH